MNAESDKVVCATPTPGKQPTRIDRWKYDAIREQILAIVDERPDGVLFKELPQLVQQRLSPANRSKLGSLMWYVTTVKLDLEVRGEIVRVAKSSPQLLQRPDAS